MRLSTIAALSAATLGLAACGNRAESTNDSANNTSTAIAANDASATLPPAATSVPGGQGFANTAAASDAFEIATSRLALASSSSPAVKKFAQQMIDAHTDSTAKLKAAAASASPAITPDPTLNVEQQAKLDALKLKTGADFDQAYIAVQVAGHQLTLNALRNYATSGDVPQLKAFAATVSPIVSGHLDMAKAIKP
jgi:putative membrane protein